ncbi:uncharacterized protein LOC117138953 [Drosophila mauritiana]|uniref:Uncharacterized protein LOC117138953 n=1 Tax=Drosophila mauritiana TaxID=7226 RepID=A0A6P8JLN5_DROMA|nr:uncharacterized protein LOC117138953 [Drosophila mauritiana]
MEYLSDLDNQLVLELEIDDMKDLLIPNDSDQEDAIAETIPLADDLKENAMDCNTPDKPLDSQSDLTDDVATVTSGSKKQKKKKRAQKATSRLVRPLTMDVTSKDAFLILYELKGVTINSMLMKRDHEGKILAHIVVNSKKYESEGSSVNAARNAACEKALREILTSKMKALLAEPEKNSGSDGDDILEKMASYAVYKLSEEWKTDAIDVSALYNDVKKKLATVVQPKTSSSDRQLPQKWKNMHPCMVLVYMLPQIIFKDLGCSDNGKFFTMGVSVDNCEFSACGLSKKGARSKLAARVCNKLFGTDYPEI